MLHFTWKIIVLIHPGIHTPESFYLSYHLKWSFEPDYKNKQALMQEALSKDIKEARKIFNRKISTM